MTEQDPQAPRPILRRTARTGVLLGFLFTFVVIGLGAYSAWMVLHACGAVLFGKVVEFPWCGRSQQALVMLQDAQGRNRTLQNEIHGLELELLSPDACGDAIETITPMPEPQPEPEPEPEEEASLCGPDQQLMPPQEVALVLDGSSSMELSVDVPEALEAEYLRLVRYNNRTNSSDPRAGRLWDQMHDIPGVERIEVARRVIAETVRGAPEDWGFDLTLFNGCNSLTTHEYEASQREEMLQRVDRFSATGGTPIAKSMLEAGRYLQGGGSADDPVNMVLVTDGGDSCGGDPCATARRLKQEKPGLIINVIDLSQTDSLRCVSEITGGTYDRQRGGDSAELVQALQQAAGYGGTGQCRPAIE